LGSRVICGLPLFIVDVPVDPEDEMDDGTLN
jgi:hypothetical protein